MGKGPDLASWILQVAKTTQDEILCDEFAARLPAYVDAELAGQRVDLAAPQVAHHLETCSVCRDEYETLRDLARLDLQDGDSTA